MQNMLVEVATTNFTIVTRGDEREIKIRVHERGKRKNGNRKDTCLQYEKCNIY